jgi:multidrug efflux system membrane fusion protein
MTPHSSHHSQSLELEPAAPPPKAVHSGRRTWFVILGLCALAAIPLVRSKLQHPAAEGGKAAAGTLGDRKPSVRVVTLQPKPFAVVLEGLGTVTPLATVTVKPQVDGPLIAVGYVEGAVVKKGQLLAEIDPRPFRIKLAQARATVQRDEAQLQNAQLDLTRFVTLRDQKLIAQQQLDAQRSQVDQLRAGLAVDQAAAANAALQLDYTRITSPIDGVAGIRQVDAGNLVHATDTSGIVVLTRLDPISVIFTLPQDELPRLAQAMDEGARKVTAVSRAGDQVLGEGQLKVIDNQVNSATATVRLKAEFANPERKLWPNQFVRARIEVAHKADALTLPAAAIQQGPNGSFVYVLADGDIAQMRPVQLGLLQGDVALLAGGVKAGERVVVEGQEQIKPNSPVTPRTGREGGAPDGAGARGKRPAGNEHGAPKAAP